MGEFCGEVTGVVVVVDVEEEGEEDDFVEEAMGSATE